MNGYPYCRNFKDNMRMINLFEAELVTLLQLNNAFHISHSTAKALISKISSVPHRVKYVEALNELKDKNADKHGVQNYVETLQYLLGCARVAVEDALDVREINDRNIGIGRHEADDDYSHHDRDRDGDDALLTQVQVDYRNQRGNRQGRD